MPMGIVSDSEFDSEFNNSGIKREKSNSQTTVVSVPTIQRIERGRGLGNVEVPDSLRKVIGETSITDGPKAAIELAESFGISRSSVSAYANGSTSTATYDKKVNNDTIQKAKDRIASKARNKLKEALNALTNEKLQVTTARELAGVAKDMSVIAKNMEPDNTNEVKDDKKPNFIFYAPTVIKNEQNFEVIHAKDG